MSQVSKLLSMTDPLIEPTWHQKQIVWPVTKGPTYQPAAMAF